MQTEAKQKALPQYNCANCHLNQSYRGQVRCIHCNAPILNPAPTPAK